MRNKTTIKSLINKDSERNYFKKNNIHNDNKKNKQVKNNSFITEKDDYNDNIINVKKKYFNEKKK